MPIRRFSTPTEVSSPRRPEIGKPTSWRKSNPISARTSPAGTVCTSVVLKGRSCAGAHLEARNRKVRTSSTLRMACIVSKARYLAKRIIQSSESRYHRSLGTKNQVAQSGFVKTCGCRRGEFFVSPATFRADGQRYLRSSRHRQNFSHGSPANPRRQHYL